MHSECIFKFERNHVNELGNCDKKDHPVFLAFSVMDGCVPTEEQLDALLAAFRSGITHAVWGEENETD